MTKILLTPHADDETLFAAYTLLREKPLVVLCFTGAPRHGAYDVRLAGSGHLLHDLHAGSENNAGADGTVRAIVA